MTQHRGHARLAALSCALLLTACDATVTPAPTGPASSQVAQGSSSPDQTAGPGLSAGPGGGSPGIGIDTPPEVPNLQVARLADPFAIGQALYDPSRMDQGVVSLLALMGVGTYRDDGTPINPGAATKPGDPWLLQSEAWGLIDMGTEDLVDAGDDGPKYRLKDLYEALQGTLAPDISLDAFIGAYTESYASHPDDLVPSVMLGQPIDASTPLTRVQLWLLYMDAFVPLATTASADARLGPVAAAPRPRSGTARASLPPLPPPQSLTAEQWRELLPHFMTIVNSIQFEVIGGKVHEGHGGTGQPTRISAVIFPGTPFRSPVSGAVLLQAGTGPLDGLQVQWRSPDVLVYNDHGTLAASIPGTGTTNAAGVASMTYTPKQEAANGKGAPANVAARISATADARDLLLRAYRIDDQSVLGFLMASTLHGTRTVASYTDIGWHGPGINITITNTYDVTFDPAAEAGGLTSTAHRTGVDIYSGTLMKLGDGTYRGVLTGHTRATSTMEFTTPLAGDRCQDSTDILQPLTVIGRLGPTAQGIDSDLFVLDSGSYGGQDLALTFYAEVPPGSEGPCQGTVHYFGAGPDGSKVTLTYASFSDSRITDPSLGGYRIHLPKIGEALEYDDRRQAKEQLPAGFGVDSIFNVIVDRQTGS